MTAPHKDLGHGAKVKGLYRMERKTKRFVYYIQDSTEVIRIRFNKDEIKGIACRITNEGRGNWKNFKTKKKCLAAQRQNNIPNSGKQMKTHLLTLARNFFANVPFPVACLFYRTCPGI